MILNFSLMTVSVAAAAIAINRGDNKRPAGLGPDGRAKLTFEA
jgi:hypothetical protein